MDDSALAPLIETLPCKLCNCIKNNSIISTKVTKISCHCNNYDVAAVISVD